MSICSLADDYLSKSQISRFERGESEITCTRLMHLLDKLHISLDEFLAIHDDHYSETESFNHLVQYIRKNYASLNIENIKALLTDSSPFTLNAFEKTMVKSIIHTVEPSIAPTENEIAQLIDYLFSVEIWGNYEMILLGNCVETIDYNFYISLTREMLKKPIYSSLNKTNKRIVTQLAINCLMESISLGKFEDCSYLIREIKKLLDNELNFYEQTVFLYACGYFDFRKNPTNGKEKMKQAIQVFDILGEEPIKAQYQNHYNTFVKPNS